MKIEIKERISADVLIIGGGGAGLRAAIEARDQGADVLMVAVSRVGYGSNTAISGGAFAAALKTENPDDSPEQHLADTVRGGYHLSDQSLVAILAREAPRQVADLAGYGVVYTDAERTPWLALTCDPGHRYYRDVSGENSFGTDFSLPLRAYAAARGVRFLEKVLVTTLVKDGDSVTGALGLDERGNLWPLSAAATVLASGGCGQLYRHHDNARGSSGDGYVLAYDAGAGLRDMEFVQWYPCGLKGGPVSLYYEILLGQNGGRLLNRAGEDILAKYGLTEPMRLTRDRVSLAIAREMADASDPAEMVTADLSQIPEERLKALAAVLPKAAGQCVMQYAVVPTVHTQIGGVSINELTETGVPGLYAACEVTGGVHGANRLGGNALTEAWVFGAIAGREAAARARQVPPPAAPGAVVKAEVSRLERIASGTAVTPPKDLLTELQDLMWRHAGLIRRADDLDQGLRRLEEFRKKLSASGVAQARELPRAVKLENMRRVGEMIMRSALARTESRGSHYRSDYPAQDDAGWMRNVTLRRDDAGMKLETAAVKSGPVPL